MSLSPKNIDFKWFFDNFWLQKSELRRNRWPLTRITCEHELSWTLARLVSISSDFLLLHHSVFPIDQTVETRLSRIAAKHAQDSKINFSQLIKSRARMSRPRPIEMTSWSTFRTTTNQRPSVTAPTVMTSHPVRNKMAAAAAGRACTRCTAWCVTWHWTAASRRENTSRVELTPEDSDWLHHHHHQQQQQQPNNE